jgi:hypothetical protein
MQVVHNLQNALTKLSPYYQAVAALDLENADLQAFASSSGVGSPVILIILEIYATLSHIQPRFGPVPASKLMHMAIPDLFIMWNDAIIKEYHVPSYPSDRPQYLAFLVLMQENIRHIRATYPGSTSQFVNNLNTECGYTGLPMTRLLDIANYAVGHPEKGAPHIKCEQCCEKANQRLRQLEDFIKQQFTPAKLGRFRSR